MLDPVPWAIGELGAEHSHEVARVLAYAATSGGEGVISSTDMKVRALATPGGSVRIGPGAMVVLNRASAGAAQSFVARVISDEPVQIPPAGAGSSRTYLVALVVRDTSIAGNGDAPADPAKGPYLFPEVVSVGSSTVTRLQDVAGYEYVTGFALARVNLPAGTGTVTNAMITDLRKMPLARSEREVAVFNSTGSGGVSGGYLSPDPLDTSEFKTWPQVASMTVDVPAWATHAIVTANVHGVSTRTNSSRGELRVNLGGTAADSSAYDETWHGTPDRLTLGTGGVIKIPDILKGDNIWVRTQGRRSGGTGHMTAQSGTSTVIDIQFVERPD